MELYIENLVEVNKVFKALELADKVDRANIRYIVKAPIQTMMVKAKNNLIAQKSVRKGDLLKSFKVESRYLRDEVYADLMTNSSHHFPTDRGTKDRYTKSGRWTGAVGKATTNYKGRNKSFKLHFATRAIESIEPGIENYLSTELEKLFNEIIARNTK